MMAEVWLPSGIRSNHGAPRHCTYCLGLIERGALDRKSVV